MGVGAGQYPEGTVPTGQPPEASHGSGQPPGSRRPRSGPLVIAVVVASVVGVVLLVVLATVTLSSLTGREFGEDTSQPPSQRHSTPTTDPTPGAPGGQKENPSGGSAGGSSSTESSTASAENVFRDVRCTFSGSSTLDPGLSESLLAGSSVQKMELKPGASFECIDEYGTSSGKVSMSAKFPALTALRGAGVGPGLIEWQTLPPDAPGAPAPGVEGPRKSVTQNEVELALPHILVWITIVDGPYAGLKGKLVLDDWELVKDVDGTIVEVRFQPTDVTFALP